MCKLIGGFAIDKNGARVALRKRLARDLVVVKSTLGRLFGNR